MNMDALDDSQLSGLNEDAKFDGRNTPVVTVILPGPLLRLFPDSTSRVKVNAATVDELLNELNQRWPGMRDRLADTSPSVRKHISIFVNGNRATLETQLPHGVDVYVLTAMSGG